MNDERSHTEQQLIGQVRSLFYLVDEPTLSIRLFPIVPRPIALNLHTRVVAHPVPGG